MGKSIASATQRNYSNSANLNQEERRMKTRNLMVCSVGCSRSWPRDVLAAPATIRRHSAAAKPLRVAVVMPSAITDMAFSQSMCQALQSVQKEMGGPSAMEIKYSENMFKVPDAAAAIRDYASQGFDIVIAHGSQYRLGGPGNRQRLPQVTFCLGHRREHLRSAQHLRLHGGSRRRRLRQRRDGGHALTKTKQIGVTGPVEVGDAKTYIDGFTQGVAATDPRQGQQDLDRLLLGRGADDGSGQDAHRRRRGRADRLLAVGGRLHRRGQG